MQPIQTPEAPTDCRHCRHYYRLRPAERFPFGCLAMAYVGRRPADEVVLDPADGPCPLFCAGEREQP